MNINFIAKLFRRREPFRYGKEYIVNLIHQFITNDPAQGPCGWDNLTLSTLKDPYEAWVQRLINYIAWYFPGRAGMSEWCHPLGKQALERLANAIETETFPYPPTEEEKYELNHDKIPLRYRNIFFGDCDPGVSMTTNDS